ncbi:DUF3732 domain-containing protein [Stenotrophomonas sp. PS02297]|uniref:DUF3732 domain-containing protein n=1 Tax=Stenotrophomonas sp. PS02297 TaxID=2991423 RepID=UPI00249A0801|nr:DUF3732 domain-containing protein [Stenotrophomonas sp. PS02297]
MSIQILDIVLYGEGRHPRVLSLKPGRLNIITGDSKTGKSALISIVDYCLGSGSYLVPHGVIRDHVVWYGLRLTDGQAQHFVARRAPDANRQSTTDAYYATGSSLDIPSLERLDVTTNIDTVVERLGVVTGIALNRHDPPEHQTRLPLTATLRHALAYVFQPQTEISQPGFLFHGQNDTWFAQAIKDTFPYFLGAVEEDHVAKSAQLKELRRELRVQEQALTRIETLTSDNSIVSLVSVARDAGLVAADHVSDSPSEAMATLQAIMSRPLTEQIDDTSTAIDQAELARLNDRRTELRRDLHRLDDELKAMIELRNEENAYTHEASEQVSRLESIGLLERSDDNHCPLCQQPSDRLPLYAELEEELRTASAQLAAVRRSTPGLEALVVEKTRELEQVRVALQENWDALEAVRRSDQRLSALHDSATRRAMVLGRISATVDSYPSHQDSSELRAHVADLAHRIKLLETELSDETVRERVDSCLSRLSERMTRWATFLELEHSGVPFRLDRRKLEVIADAESGPIPMSAMGSGANWLGCHLIAHLALHEWFVRKERPVPRFLFLDQPSQVYFPAEAHAGMSGELPQDEDRLAVVRIFELIDNLVKELAPHMQVIMTEHADLNEAWFQKAVTERWRNGAALIPLEWRQPSLD